MSIKPKNSYQKQCLKKFIIHEDLNFLINFAPVENFEIDVVQCEMRCHYNKHLHWITIQNHGEERYTIRVQIIKPADLPEDDVIDIESTIIWNQKTKAIEEHKGDIELNLIEKYFFTPQYKLSKEKIISILTSHYIDGPNFNTNKDQYHWFFDQWYHNNNSSIFTKKYRIRENDGKNYKIDIVIEDCSDPIRTRMEIQCYWSAKNIISVFDVKIFGFSIDEASRVDIFNMIQHLILSNVKISFDKICQYTFYNGKQELERVIDKKSGMYLHKDLIPLIAGFLAEEDD